MADDAAILRIGTTLDELALLYPWLESEAGAQAVPKDAAQKMHVALEEAVMNVAMHAYAPGEAGEITIRLLATPGSAALVIEDAGPAFDPTAATPPPRPGSIDEARVGGLGLTLLRHYCPDISYQREAERNRLTLRFSTARGCER